MGRERDEERREGELSPAEFTRRMPEEPAGAGPGSSETDEPVQGRDPDAGGPGGPAMAGMGGSGPEGEPVSQGEGPEDVEAQRGSRREPWQQGDGPPGRDG